MAGDGGGGANLYTLEGGLNINIFREGGGGGGGRKQHILG